MNRAEHRIKYWHWTTLAYRAGCVCLTVAFALGAMSGLTGVAGAAPSAATAPSLGAAAGFSALGKAGATNVGNSTLGGSVGADNSRSHITDFPPGMAGRCLSGSEPGRGRCQQCRPCFDRPGAGYAHR